MRTINIQYYKTKIGELILGSFENKLCILDFRYRKMRSTVDKRIKEGLQAEFIERDNRGTVSNHPIFAIFSKFRLRLVSSTPKINHI